MNEIDELFRTYMAAVPTPAPGTPDQLGRDIVERPGRTRHCIGGAWWRRSKALVGGFGVASLAVVLGLLLVWAPSRPDATTSIGEPRVSWGMTAVVTVEPSPGASSDDSVAQLIRALRERARARDIAGLSVDRVAPGSLRLTIPGAFSRADVESLLHFPAIDVYELSRSQIASGPGLADLAAAARNLPGPAVRYLVQASPTGGYVQVTSTRAEAEAMLGASGAQGGGIIVPIPKGVVLLDRFTGLFPEVALLRATPIVPAEQLAGASFVGPNLTLVSTEADRLTVRGTIDRALASGAGSRLAVVSRQPNGRASEIATTGNVVATDTGFVLNGLREDSDEHVVFGSSEPLVAVTIADVSSIPYGSASAPAGERVAKLPSSLEDPKLTSFEPGTSPTEPGAAVPVVRGSIVKALTASLGRQTWSVYEGLTTTGREASWIVGQANDPDASGAECGPGPGIPVLRACGSRGINDRFVAFGRVRSEVASIEGRTGDGTIRSGTVGNGWFLIPFTQSGLVTSPMDIIARDGAGNVLATVVGGARLELTDVSP